MLSRRGSTWMHLDVNFHRTGTFHQGMWANGKTTACMVGEGALQKIRLENWARCKKNTPGDFFVNEFLLTSCGVCFKDVYN